MNRETGVHMGTSQHEWKNRPHNNLQYDTIYIKLQKHEDNPRYAYIQAYKTIHGIILINRKTESSGYLCT